MSTKSKWRNGILTFFDSSTYETVKPCSAIELYEDFIGALNTSVWTVIDSGSETELKVANQHGGIFELLLNTKDEKQIPGIACGDRLEFNIDKGTIFESRVAIQALPTLLAEGFWGVSGVHADGTITTGAGPLIHAFFLVDGSGEVFVHTDDNVTSSAFVTTGITVVAGEYHLYRIDLTTTSDIKFYIDGVNVASGTTFDMSAGSPQLQPYFRLHKASDVASILVDADGSTFAAWTGTSCDITDSGANLLITANDAGGTQTAKYTLAGLVPGNLHKVTITIADGTGAWGAGDSLAVTTNAGGAIGSVSMAAGAGTYTLDWTAAGATDKIVVVGTVANLATLNITSIYAGTGAKGSIRIDAVRVWDTR